MYSLDINFLNDRPDLKPDGGGRGGAGGAIAFAADDKRPLYWGLGVMVLALVGPLLGWVFLNLQVGSLQEQQTQLDAQLGNLDTKKKELADAQAKVKAAEDEIQALASVFNQIKPWSAMAQDLRDRLPPGIQITEIKQVLPQNQQPNTAVSPNSGTVEIDGRANDFGQVNDFLVVLQQSKFLKPDQTKIVGAERLSPIALQSVKLPVDVGTSNSQVKLPKLPGGVKFTIATAISDASTADLLRELDRKGAVGLVSRIEALKSKGVIKP